jgi:hypothetical protein
MALFYAYGNYGNFCPIGYYKLLYIQIERWDITTKCVILK